MGEVYRARDTRLDRDVAVKVLPASFADDPDRRARFEREARAVAALSHPNILAIFDVGEHDGTTYAVTELLEGETLRERLSQSSSSTPRGAPPPLGAAPRLADSRIAAAAGAPVRKAIDIAVRIAHGLAAAHDKGLVHRDLKPENVFLLKDGQVKILDFGLARQAAASDAGSGATRTVAATDPGTVMGTVGYMAPEQVRGQAVDARTDLFALGALLYEMLTGQRAFQRDTPAETMTAILREDPPELSASRAELSPALDRIVRHCLEKNPAERFQSARDVAFALEALSGSATASSGSAAVPAAGPVRRPSRWMLVAASLIVGAAAGLAAGRTLFVSAAHPATFDPKTWDAQWITNARFTPDGQTLVFSAAREGNTPRVFVIRPGSVVSQPLGPAGTELLAVSGTNELAVLTGAHLISHRVFEGTLARMTLDGAQRPVLEHVTEADWSPDGQDLAVIHAAGGRSQLEYPIGQKLYDTAGYLSDPRVSPDGRTVAFFEHLIPLDDRGWVKTVDRSGHVTTLSDEYSALEGLAWSPDGRSLHFTASRQAEEDQAYSVGAAGGTAPVMSLSSAGNLLLLDVSRTGQELATVDTIRHTIRGQVPGEQGEREFPWLDFEVGGFFSRDGRLLAFTDLNQNSGSDYAVSLRGTDGSPVVRLGPGGSFGFSPDAKWVLAIVPSKQQVVLYPTGPGAPVNLVRGPIKTYRYVSAWFSDGTRVLLCGTEASGASRCYQQRVSGGPPEPITPDGTAEAYLAADDKTLLMLRSNGTWALGSIGSTASTPAPGLTADDIALGFSRDGRSVFVQAGNGVPARVDRVDLSTGARTLARELAPPDRSGVTGVGVDQWADDGRTYTYRYIRTLSTLYVVSREQ